MKYLLINARYAPYLYGGAEISVGSFAEGLVQLGHQVSVLTTHRGPAATLWIKGVKVLQVPSRSIYWEVPGTTQPRWKKLCWHVTDLFNPLMLRAVRVAIDAEQPDLVETHALEGFSCAAWYAAKRSGLPLVHYIHSYYLMCPRATMARRGVNCQTACMSCRAFTSPRFNASALVDGVIANSQFILNRHVDAGFFSNASHRAVIHGSYRSDGFPVEQEREPGPLRLGYIGRLDPTKGIDWLLRRLRGLESTGWELRIAGRGSIEYERQLKALAAGMPVQFLGHQAPPVFFPQIDLLVVPSLWNEPQGRIVFEAYAHGVPVAVSRQGGLPELVVDGETGFVFDVDDGTIFDRLIKELIGQPSILRAKLPEVSAKAREFTPEASAAKLADFARAVLNSSAERRRRLFPL